MNHNEVYAIFKNMLPLYDEQTIKWFPTGKNRIRIRKKDGEEFIFTYNDENDWLFETVDHFLERMKGEKRM